MPSHWLQQGPVLRTSSFCSQISLHFNDPIVCAQLHNCTYYAHAHIPSAELCANPFLRFSPPLTSCVYCAHAERVWGRDYFESTVGLFVETNRCLNQLRTAAFGSFGPFAWIGLIACCYQLLASIPGRRTASHTCYTCARAYHSRNTRTVAVSPSMILVWRVTEVSSHSTQGNLSSNEVKWW